MNIRPLFILLGCALAIPVLVAGPSASAQDMVKLRELRRLTEDFCKAPELYGFKREQSGHVGGHIDANLLSKRSAELGISADVQRKFSDWRGIPQDKLSDSLADYRACIRDIYGKMLDKFSAKETDLVSVEFRTNGSWIDATRLNYTVDIPMSGATLKIDNQSGRISWNNILFRPTGDAFALERNKAYTVRINLVLFRDGVGPVNDTCAFEYIFEKSGQYTPIVVVVPRNVGFTFAYCGINRLY